MLCLGSLKPMSESGYVEERRLRPLNRKGCQTHLDLDKRLRDANLQWLSVDYNRNTIKNNIQNALKHKFT